MGREWQLELASSTWAWL